jgi:hypothetical protein
MRHTFKPGELAMIVGTIKRPENVGKACELVAFMAPGARLIIEFNGPLEVTHIGSQPAWLVAGDGVTGSTGKLGLALVRPDHLMPLRGDFTPEQQKAQAVSA